MDRVLSGVQPSGDLHLGNYVGAFRQWVARQADHDAFYCIVDLHALTLEIDPAELRRRTLETAAGFLAVGLDPKLSTIFCQSHVPEHPRLSWLLECTATMGELRRMTQFKDKGRGQEAVRVGLFTYPVLMAADILLYDAARVPVGDDQRQHLELARELAVRFNNRYGPTFTVPDPAIPAFGARVMDLQHPDRKMSKSVDSPLGTVGLFEPPAEIARKVRRAVTDTDGEMVFDPVRKPGLANLLQLLAAVRGVRPDEVASGYDRYGELKRDLADELAEMLRPLRERYVELLEDAPSVQAVLDEGAERAHEVAAATYARAADAVGLLAPGLLAPGTGRAP